MINIALLGCGRIGWVHGPNVAAHRGARLVCVSDAVPSAAAALADQTGAAVRPLDDAVVADDVQAVVICTPTDTHADLIERAARAGKAVLCEKPIDLSVARVRDCLAVVDGTGVPLMVGFNRRFDPHFAAVKQRLDAGAIGRPEIVTILSRDPAPPPIDYIERSGGLFRDMMIHDLDMARFLLGDEPIEVQASAAALVDPAIAAAGDIDTAVVTLRTASGRLCQISNSRRASYGYDQRIEVHGETGLLRAGNVHETTVEHANADGVRGDPIQHFFVERYAAAYRAELAAFIEGIGTGKVIGATGSDGLKALILADAAEEALATGRTVRVGA